MTKTEQQFLAEYDKYASAIYKHIYYRVSSKHLAEDLTQEVFFKAWRHLTRGEKIDNYKNFFYRIAHNLLVDYYRAKIKEPISLEDIKEKENEKLSETKEINRISDKTTIENALVKLDQEQRDIITMRYVDGFGVKEIAKITGKTPNNISVIIHRSLKILKDKIENHV